MFPKISFNMLKKTVRLDQMKLNLYVPAEMKLLHYTSSFFFYSPDP